MVFLPGDHVLDRNISVDNVTRLTIQGKSSSSSGNIATVFHNGSVSFNFTNMADFNICSLAFTSHNRSWSYGSHPASNSGLGLQSTRNAKLVDCSFHDNLGTALAVCNTNITLTGNNEFIHNYSACESFSERCNLRCAITAVNSTLKITSNQGLPVLQCSSEGVILMCRASFTSCSCPQSSSSDRLSTQCLLRASNTIPCTVWSGVSYSLQL